MAWRRRAPAEIGSERIFQRFRAEDQVVEIALPPIVGQPAAQAQSLRAAELEAVRLFLRQDQTDFPDELDAQVLAHPVAQLPAQVGAGQEAVIVRCGIGPSSMRNLC